MTIGIDRLIQDLVKEGFEQTATLHDAGGMAYVMIPQFVIPAGSFAGRSINLAIPAPADYPRSTISSIHIQANPHLVAKANTGTRNVIDSPLGTEWQYWSYQFQLDPSSPTSQLINQINAIFRNN